MCENVQGKRRRMRLGLSSRHCRFVGHGAGVTRMQGRMSLRTAGARAAMDPSWAMLLLHARSEHAEQCAAQPLRKGRASMCERCKQGKVDGEKKG
jgi:hypothetical protein